MFISTPNSFTQHCVLI